MVSRAPAHLGRRGRATWAALTGVYEFDAHEEELLAEVCRVLDVLDALDAAVRRDGILTDVGKVNPAAVEARQQRLTLARLMGALRLPDESGKSLTPAQVHAQKAAQSRWARREPRDGTGA